MEDEFWSIEWKDCQSNGHFGNGVKLFPGTQKDQAYGWYLCFSEKEEQKDKHGTVELWHIQGNHKTLCCRLERPKIQC